MSESSPLEKYWILIPAAGVGKRMGSEIPKQYLSIAGRSILAWTLERMSQVEDIQQIVLVLHPQEKLQVSDSQCGDLPTLKNLLTVDGGGERIDSVMNGLNSLKSQADKSDWILVHDAVRPCVSVSDINKLISSLSGDSVGGLLASPVIDTLKLSTSDTDSELVVSETLDRSKHWLAATPQMFRYGLLCEALEHAKTNKLKITDEASAMEAMGHRVKLIAGRSDNIKVTQPSDLALVEFLLKQQAEQEDNDSEI